MSTSTRKNVPPGGPRDGPGFRVSVLYVPHALHHPDPSRSQKRDYRFARFTSNDHSAVLWISSLLSMIYATLVLIVRLVYVKKRAHALDDVLITLAHIVGFAMWVSLFVSMKNGLGQSLEVVDVAHVTRLQESFFASRIILYVALALSKCSILIVIRNVFERKPIIAHTANGTMAVVAGWGLVGVLAASVGCSPGNIIPKVGEGYCIQSIPWLQAITAIDIVTELIILLSPILGFYDTLMPLKRRLAVILAFSTRLPNVAISINHLIAYSKFINDQQQAIDITSVINWQNILLSYSLMSATLPTLKGFTEGFNTAGVSLGYGRDGTTYGANSGTHGSHELQTISRIRTRPKLVTNEDGLTESQPYTTAIEQESNRMSTRAESASKDQVNCYHDEGASITSHDSQRIMIKQEWKVSYGQ
ncbi:hypothetical protein FB567DRAFT_332148 [Paraphoma chrysanthemicola]|uniref:Rhodopsin domain-containing protein n=1 Tax=Paraphoma chrysanthemicola TaxID=798071 RepID=A0A8K0R7Y6_9PLEO|nr:hypothetical protein FB567DRAFT_332148 [Paraphoma chrysanthemicola]